MAEKLEKTLESVQALQGDDSVSTRLPDALEPMAADLDRLEDFLRDDTGIGFVLLSQLLRSTFASGGKRIRPALVFAVARLDPEMARSEPILRLAAAIETLHAATLVHDDLVDGALLRRGMPTLHKRWGAGATVLAGDWLFARSARFVASTGNIRAVQLFARTLGALTDGELRQLMGRQGLPSREEYDYRIYAKTGSLFETSTEASAEILGLPPAKVEALARYGRELGMAFQIIDDILDFTATESVLGKPVGSDLRSGQYTLPVMFHLESNPDSAPWLFNGSKETAADTATLVENVRADETALAAARAAADVHIQNAIEALRSAPEGPARDDLERIARYAVERAF